MSSNWISITVDDLNDHKVAALVDALREAALADGQSDPAPRVIQSVVNGIRLKVASCERNQVDADPTRIPASLKDMAVELIVHALKNRLEIELTPAEETRRSEIRADLNRIADCRDKVEQPDAPSVPDVSGGGGIELISPGNRQASRRQTAGL